MTFTSESYVYAGLGSEGGRTGYGLYRMRSGQQSGWQLATAGLPQDPEVRVIAIAPYDPCTIFAGVQDGLYRSNDCGDHWNRLPLPCKDVMIWSVAFDPKNAKTMYIGGEDSNMFRSVDGGDNWQIMPINVTYPTITMMPKPQPKRLLSIAIDPNQSDEMYAAIEVGGLIRSRDGGETWTGVSEGHYQNDDPVDLHGVLVDSSHARHISVISRVGVYHSNDGGDHWSWGNVQRLGTTGTYCRVIRESPADPNILYLATGPEFRGDLGVLFRSSNGGNSWEKVEMGIIPESTLFGLAINRENPDEVYCATRHGQVLGSADGGQTWEDFSLPTHASEVNSLACG